VTLLGMVCIHTVLETVTPPKHLPHLFILVLTSYSCAYFCGAFLYCNIELLGHTKWHWSSVTKPKTMTKPMTKTMPMPMTKTKTQ
jgi:hypothetical protein